MQIKGLHKNIYKLYQMFRTEECIKKYREKYEEQVKQWEGWRKEGLSNSQCSKIVGISKATYYRHKKIMKDLVIRKIIPPSKKPKRLNKPRWGESEKQLVLKIRRENPTYGKFKIAKILRRDFGKTMSESTVGRILTHLFEKKLITKSISAIRKKRKRNFTNGHAKPFKFKEYEKIQIGEYVQVDHMTTSKNGVYLKHFQAWDRRSRYIHAQIYSNAKSTSAKKFLLELLKKLPFKTKSIQVDGGSEFMAHFEDACADLGIELMVLPPRRPQYNGGVERTNRTFKEEFYYTNKTNSDSIGALRYDLAQHLHKHNNYRPHSGLAGLTPMEYIKNNLFEGSQLSQTI